MDRDRIGMGLQCMAVLVVFPLDHPGLVRDRPICKDHLVDLRWADPDHKVLPLT